MSIELEAPPFHVWTASGTHAIICTDRKDARERSAYGVERCTDPDCDWCADNRQLTLVVTNR